MMNLLIIGASHGIGLETVKQALEAGHTVTAFARHPEKIGIVHPHLRAVVGDVLDTSSLDAAVAGQGAVIVSLGIPPTRKQVTVFSEGTRNVISAMKNHGVKLLICITGIGAGDSRGHGGFMYDQVIQPLLLKTIYADKDREEIIIKESGLNWIIIRPGFLTHGPVTGKYRVLTDISGVTAGSISRADVAHFMLSQVREPAYLHQTPLITY